MRILAFGSRDWTSQDAVDYKLDRLLGIYLASPPEFYWYDGDYFTIIQGEARGADSMAKDWFFRNNDKYMDLKRYPADWDQYGKKAGPIRNQKMLYEGKPTYFVGFILNESPGSMDMLSRLQDFRIPGEVVYDYL